MQYVAPPANGLFARRVCGMLNSIAAAAAIVLNLAPQLLAADVEQQFDQTVRPFVATYCVACHGGPNPAAQFDLRQYLSVADVVRDHPRWALVAEKLTAMAMP